MVIVKILSLFLKLFKIKNDSNFCKICDEFFDKNNQNATILKIIKILKNFYCRFTSESPKVMFKPFDS